MMRLCHIAVGASALIAFVSAQVATDFSDELPNNVQVVNNPGYESLADDPLTEFGEDALQPTNDFLDFEEKNAIARRSALDQKTEYALNPVIYEVDTGRQAYRDGLYGASDVAYFEKMAYYNKISGAPAEEFDPEDAPRQNVAGTSGTSTNTFRGTGTGTFQSAVNPLIDEKYGKADVGTAEKSSFFSGLFAGKAATEQAGAVTTPAPAATAEKAGVFSGLFASKTGGDAAATPLGGLSFGSLGKRR